MNLRVTTHAAFPTGLNQMPNLAGLGTFPEHGKLKDGRPNHQHQQPEQSAQVDAGIEAVPDAGLGAMTGLGVALLFNAGLAIAGLVGWELFTLFR